MQFFSFLPHGPFDYLSMISYASMYHFLHFDPIQPPPASPWANINMILAGKLCRDALGRCRFLDGAEHILGRSIRSCEVGLYQESLWRKSLNPEECDTLVSLLENLGMKCASAVPPSIHRFFFFSCPLLATGTHPL